MLNKLFSIFLFSFLILTFLTLPAVAQNPDSIPFAPAVNYPAGDRPLSVFCADLDEDKDFDLAVANSNYPQFIGSNISILKNNGDGTFQTKVDYEVGDGFYSVFCADLDRDSDLDLAVPNYYGSNVSILKNNGDGTLETKVDYGVGDGPVSVFCADLDADGNLDLAVANHWGDNISILKNNGDGTFQTKVDYGVGDGPHSVFCADLDGDKDLDLVTANWYGNNVSILKNNGDGVFQLDSNYGAGNRVPFTFCADLDGDGDLDLAVSNYYSSSVSILKNNGDGTFQTKVDYGTGLYTSGVFCADLDGDGHFDLAVANAGSDNVSILKNNGDGTFQTKVDYGVGRAPNSVFCADLDGDGDLDLAVANIYSDNISILLNLTKSVGSISGTVSDSLGGLLGVTVDLFDNTGSLIWFAHTDPSGFFSFDSLNAGDYTVSIVTPLGYVADFESRLVTLTPNADSVVNFMLHRLGVTSSQRSMGYWKHQVNVYLSGKGNAQESLTNMSKYMSRIKTHFNDNLSNPVTIFQVPQPATQRDSLEALQKLLTVNKDGTANDRAKQQLIALMLNIVSSKLHQTTAVSQDGATASQAVTYCNELITDSDPTNDEIAKDIADNINNGLLISAGIIPTTTPIIMYKYKGGSEGDSEGDLIEAWDVPKSFGLLQNYPNPFNLSTRIEFSLKHSGFVSLSIYDILGRKVRALVSQDLPSGHKSAVWDGKDDKGLEVASGIYFYRIQAGDFTDSKRMLLLK